MLTGQEILVGWYGQVALIAQCVCVCVYIYIYIYIFFFFLAKKQA